MPGTEDQRPLRLLICLLYYLPHRTGLTLYVERLAQGLAARGYQVTVLCAHHDADTALGEAWESGVRVVRLKTLPLAISRGLVCVGYPLALWRLLREHDVVSVHTPMMETALVGLMSHAAGRPVVCTHHGDLVLPRGLLNRVIEATMYRFYRVLAKRSAAIVTHSMDYAENSRYLRPFLDRVAVIHPPVAMPPPNLEAAARLRQEWSAGGAPIIGYAGRFVEEKRPDLLIRSLEVVHASYPGARIVFAGRQDVPYERTWQQHQALVQRWQQHLIFLGVRAEPQQMSDFYAACDLLALSSDTECFALVQVEAMLCGTPVVMTDTPGGRVPVQVTGMGKIARRGDWQSIGETIVAALAERAQLLRPVADIERHFGIADTLDRYQALLRDCVSGRASTPAAPS